MDHRPSRTRRFANAVTKFPGLRILWAILTFGYSFPRIRKGENLPVCILKSIVILVFRFTCVIGAIWYFNEWVEYITKHQARPFNVLERQELREFGTPVPMLTFYSGSQGTLKINSVSYVTKMNRENITDQSHIVELLHNDTVSNDVGDEMLTFNLTALLPNMSAGNTNMESLEVELTQTQLPTSFKWVQVGLIHPWQESPDGSFLQEDLYNQYFFLPGHIVEIRYISMRSEQPMETGKTFREKFLLFFGFAEDVKSYSYKSTVNISPIPDGFYSNTSTVIIIRPQANIEIFSYKEEKVRFRDMLSNIGGLISTIGGAIAFLFGASLLSPWGFVADLSIFRRKISGSLAKAYDTGDGFSKGPFTTPFVETGKFPQDLQSPDEKITMLKERIDELEMVLKEFYLDGDVFEYYAAERDKLKLSHAHNLSQSARKAGVGYDPDQNNRADKSELQMV
ncbi:hypothetical protein BGZ76_007555 [Entomortierella beljakovae]|nr:hypothetical protein BGZ76_007555 [Entomortierella beljakovae]